MLLHVEVIRRLNALREYVANLADPQNSVQYSTIAHDSSSAPLWIYSKRFDNHLIFRVAKILLLIFLLSVSIVWFQFNTARSSLVPTRIVPDYKFHPIKQLADQADEQFQSLRTSQSPTLAAAVTEYRRRYVLPPPPNFDRWYDYATQHSTELIDEFDTIHKSLILFWGIEPLAIRNRTLEALGYHNSVIAVSIRAGEVRVHGIRQGDYQGQAIKEMISPFSKWLPDMDLAFNTMDEPRILVPHEDTVRLMAAATASLSSVKPSSTIYSHANDLGDGRVYQAVSETPFNRFDHQQIFRHSIMSCPSARGFGQLTDDANITFTYDGIAFVENVTTYSDLCLHPSARQLIGVINHPNALSVSHDLIPIFSPSRPSTFHDILYPSYYYYTDQTPYHDAVAVPWDDKAPKLYWRGSTGGGYSERGIWKSLLRQSILTKLKSRGTTKILSQNPDEKDEVTWHARKVKQSAMSTRYDTKFTEIKQCDKHDCAEMQAEFGIHFHSPQAEAWKNRYLLDMDGNAYSGRFYTFLKSFSLPLKVSFYREWHMDRIFPWVHYVPVTSTTDEYAEVIRYFEEEAEGQQIARRLALQGRDWAHNVTTKSAMEVYMFRLLLEYGRVVDDNRLMLGFQPKSER